MEILDSLPLWVWFIFAILIVLLILVFLLFLKLQKNFTDFTLQLNTTQEALGSKVELDLQKQLFSSQQGLIKYISDEQRQTEKSLGDLQLKMISGLAESTEKNLKGQRFFQQDFSKSLKEDFNHLNALMEKRLEHLSLKVRENLDQGFKKTNETFQNVMERLTRIDEAQKKIEELSGEVVSLQEVLTDKKSRGIFGEVQLHQILSSVFGEKNEKLFSLQYSLSNKTIVDAVLFLPEPTGMVPIDSKFPLENYRRKVDRSLSEPERNIAEKEFVKNLKKHIDDISEKYVKVKETADQAILFLPAEAIFAEVNAYHPEIIDYAYRNKVIIASPTTLLSLLSTIQVVHNNIERNKYTTIIHEELNRLAQDFSRYKKRWDNLSKHIDTVSKDVKEIHQSTEKITRKFDKISQVDIQELEAPK